MNQIGFIGDIHGCLEQLDEVVASSLSYTSQLVFLGDYVDRGRYSRQVIDYLIKLEEDENKSITFLAGNHDIAFMRAIIEAKLDEFLLMGGATTIRSYIKEPASDIVMQLRATVPSSHLQFLSRLKTSFVAEGIVAAHEQAANQNTVADPRPYGVFGHIPRPAMLPSVTRERALIDTGCGTLPGGKLTAFFWPSGQWIQSRAWS